METGWVARSYMFVVGLWFPFLIIVGIPKNFTLHNQIIKIESKESMRMTKI